jgi:hypothetical protein
MRDNDAEMKAQQAAIEAKQKEIETPSRPATRRSGSAIAS